MSNLLIGKLDNFDDLLIIRLYMKQSLRSPQVWLGILVSLITFGAIFLFIEPAEIAEALREARYGYLLLTIVGIYLFMIIRAFRWRFLLNNEIDWQPVFHIQNVGYMLNNLLPLRAGDIARAILIGNVPPITIARGLPTMVLDRVLDLVFMLVLFPFVIPTDGLPDSVQTGVQTVRFFVIVFMVVVVVSANQRPFIRRLSKNLLTRLRIPNTDRWVQQLDDLLAGLDTFTRLKDGLILALLSAAVWLPIIAAYYAGLLAVNIEPTWSIAGFVVCAAAFSIAAPSSPGQVGVFHVGVTFALVEILGQPEGASASFALLYHAINFVFLTLLGIYSLNRIGSTFSSILDSIQTYRARNTS